jgi:hypothetical protein
MALSAALRHLGRSFALHPAAPPVLTSTAMWQASLLGLGLAIGVLVGGFALCFPFYQGVQPLLALPVVPVLSLVLLAGLGGCLRLLTGNGPNWAAAAFAATPVVLLQAVLAVLIVAPLGQLDAREPELAIGALLFTIGLTWGSALLHTAWLTCLGLSTRLSAPLAGLVALVAQVLAYWCWGLLAGEGLAFDFRDFI